MTLAIESVETFVCCKCNGAIPADCTSRKFDERTATRTTKIFCEHCGELFKAVQRFVGGTWIVEGDIERVTDPKQIAGMKARIDHVRGNRTIPARKI